MGVNSKILERNTKKKMNNKTLGSMLVAFAIILLFVLTFVKRDVDKQAAELCSAYQKKNLDMKDCPVHNSNISWLIVFAFGLGFLVLGAGIYMILFTKTAHEETKKDFKKIDPNRLDETEKKIYELIKTKGGSLYQTDIIKETGLSKVKTTRLLDKLELMGILERKRRGMTNIIVLK